MISKNNNNVVILETNPAQRDYLRSICSQWGYTPISFDKEAICLDNLSLLNPFLVISGSLSLDRTFRFVNTLKMRNNDLRILILSNEHEIKQFIIINGFEGVAVIQPSNEPHDIKRAIARIQNSGMKREIYQYYPFIVGNSPAMVKIKRIISEIRDSKDSILIQGEPGTGKEMVARAIHYLSNRKNNPFVKVKVAGLSTDWFGYKENDIGRAHQNKKEIFELANTGTIFLDRIEKASDSFQSKMLQILDEKSILGSGIEANGNVDVRIVASARENLNMLVKEKKFRKDLFYRLNVINIKIPPLKHRIEDIPLLTDFFNDKFCGEFGRCYGDVPQKTKDIFAGYHWPGNVREIKNVIKNLVFSDDKDNVVQKFVNNNQKHESLCFTDDKRASSGLLDISNIKRTLKDLNKISLKDIQKEFIIKTEKKLMREALVKTNWNRKKASILLDISYKSLLNKIKAYNLT